MEIFTTGHVIDGSDELWEGIAEPDKKFSLFGGKRIDDEVRWERVWRVGILHGGLNSAVRSFLIITDRLYRDLK